jgi:ribosomal-protein-alanine N-acetyltransferase
MKELRLALIEEAGLADVVELELDCGLKTGGVKRFLGLLPDPRTILLGAFTDRLVGFFSGQVILDELQVDNVAVRPEWRCQGIGHRLVEAALEAARLRGALTAVLEVRASNFAAQNLYRRFGFSVAGRRAGYYSSPVEDALTMTGRIRVKT